MTSEFAPAKVNLTLHITGQRDDGYHLLDSLVMFADVGDEVTVADGTSLSLEIDGPEAGSLPVTNDNSVLHAARLADPDCTASITLTKNLPVASGIGGGSADAAATYRSLVGRGSPRLPDPIEIATVATLGADVPVCLYSQTTHMSGIGEQLRLLPNLPSVFAVLVNPRIEVSTPDVFRALISKKGSPMPTPPEQFGRVQDLISWVSERRNDLQRPAVTLVPEIGYVLRAIEFSNGCKLSRMSGSGATCFGLYDNERFAQAAATRLAQLHPQWWVRACMLGGKN
ncbi:4-(cytidine 5'-diphospho)-2-C-methyl-D-erythritol kinase [uncultured Litoreibacter sp.]|uniref:4-(cytidine 5'-diphospho)-2-C-methyl-D-erythritol kinase n=1 Tax=uncultured Litoreibacter sp. TaxID=1392394 RepID=UPI002606A656|nr:4-(cytidine 5'-diphospho)-2-C-methyl-D-erythritol kinase [uncultured Litoreibacter sp.]